jgi:hypothetical protein
MQQDRIQGEWQESMQQDRIQGEWQESMQQDRIQGEWQESMQLEFTADSNGIGLLVPWDKDNRIEGSL